MRKTISIVTISIATSIATMLLTSPSVVCAEDSASLTPKSEKNKTKITSVTNKTAKKSQKTSQKRTSASETALMPSTPVVTAKIKSFVEPKLTNHSLSEYAFQVGENQKSLSVAPRYSKVDISYKLGGANSSMSETYNLVDLTYSQAMGPEWVGMVSTSVGNSTSEYKGTNSAKSSGVADLELKAQKVASKIEGQEFYGGFVTLSPSEKEYAYDNNSGSRTGNLNSGGHSFGSFYGDQKNDGNKVLGYKATGQYFLTRKESVLKNLNREVSGGHRLAIETFAEFTDKKPVYIGVKGGFSYLLPENSTFELDGHKGSSLDTKAQQILNFGAYGRINMNEKISLLPAIQFQKLLSSSGGDFSRESFEDFNLNISARIAL